MIIKNYIKTVIDFCKCINYCEITDIYDILIKTMQDTMKYLCENIEGYRIYRYRKRF